MAADLLKGVFGRKAAQRHTGKLDHAFARLVGRNKSAAFAHARCAIYSILKELDITAGKEVLLSPFTTPHIVEAIKLAGLVPRFVDIELDTLALDPVLLDEAASPASSVVIITPLFGICPRMNELVSVARKHDLFVIEDVSQALLAEVDGRPCGSFGDAAVYSCSVSKDVDAYSGGLVALDNELLWRRIVVSEERLFPPSRKTVCVSIFASIVIALVLTPLGVWALNRIGLPLLRYVSPGVYQVFRHGRVQHKTYKTVPSAWRRQFSRLQEEAGLQAISKAAEMRAVRVRQIEDLASQLGDGLHAPAGSPASIPSYWQWVVLCERPQEEVARQLRALGVDAGPMLLPVCNELKVGNPEGSATPVAAWLKRHALIVPAYPGLTERQLAKVKGALSRVRAEQPARRGSLVP